MAPFLRPDTLGQATAALAADPALRVLAGGTDLYPGAGARLAGPVLDVTGLPGLNGITRAEGGLRIGAATTWDSIARARLPAACSALQQAARQVGGRQVQNAGTIGGNLCNASPAADGVPPLLVLGAMVDLAGPAGLRRLALADFLTGPRRTALGPAEMLVAVILPDQALTGASAFCKLGARAYLVISIAMVAARVVADGDRAADVALAVGSCSATARRLPAVEADLIGLPLQALAGAVNPAAVAAALAPIADIRATAAYRAEAAGVLVARALAAATQGLVTGKLLMGTPAMGGRP